jgi:hypothetical protein
MPHGAVAATTPERLCVDGLSAAGLVWVSGVAIPGRMPLFLGLLRVSSRNPDIAAHLCAGACGY